MQQMTQRLIKRLSALGQYEEAVAALAALERPAAALKSKASASGQRSDVMSVCEDAFVLAQQLTHIELVRANATMWCMTFVSSGPRGSSLSVFLTSFPAL